MQNSESSSGFPLTITELSSQRGQSAYDLALANSEKDALIDDMQKKIGELLQCNQDLVVAKQQVCSLKAQITDLKKTYEKTIANLQKQLTSLQEENEIISQENHEQQDKIAMLKDANKHLNNTLLDTQTKSHEEIVSLKSHYENEIVKLTSHLNAEIASRDQQIDNLQNKVLELKQESSDSNASMIQQKIENERITTEKDVLYKTKKQKEKQLRKLAKHSKMLRAALDKIKREKEEIRIALDNETSAKSCIDDQLSSLQSAHDSLSSHTRLLEERLQRVMSITEGDFESVIQKLTNAMTLLPENEQKIKEQETELHQCKQQIASLQDDNKIKQNEIEKHEEKEEELVKRIHKLNDKIEYLNERSYIGQVLEKVNQSMLLSQRQLKSDIDENDDLSLRNVVITVMIIKRFKQLAQQPRTCYHNFSNWYFMQSTQANPVQEFSKKLKSVKDSLAFSNNVIESQKVSMGNMGRQIAEAGQKIADLEGVVDAYKSKLHDYKEKIKSLVELVKTKIDPEVYSQLQQEYSALKIAFKKLKVERNGIDKHNHVLEKQVAELTASVTEQQCSVRLGQKVNNQIRSQLMEISERNDVLEAALETKRKEILALERRVDKEHREKQSMDTQCFVMAAENQHLKVVEKPIHINSSSTDLGQRLIALSQNLSEF